MMSIIRGLRRLPAGLLTGGLLAAVFAAAAVMPIPTAGNEPLEEVLEEVESRLPGWNVIRANESWENNYTVVAVCADREVGFQVIPARRMAPGDAFIVPDDRFSRSRLRIVADDHRHLFWRAGSGADHQLVCEDQLAADSRAAAAAMDH
jgi:hypothetical protein